MRSAVAPTRLIRTLCEGGHHGVADASIRLDTAHAYYWVRRCEPKNSADPQSAIGAAMGVPVEMLLDMVKIFGVVF
jgi:hypothetical protein